jgi:ABC-type transport system involved in multi-copper enzyme maturation permease subunit
MNRIARVFSIAKFTIDDEIHNKSFFVLFGVCVLLVMAIRGCYKSEYVINGQRLDGIAVAWQTSVTAYHIIAVFGMFTAMMLANRVLRKDRENGSVVFILSRAISRLEYIAGKVLGIWLLSFSFMFLLHVTVFILTLTVTGGMLPMLPVASLLNGLCILFCVCLFMLLSQMFPEFIALVIGIVITIVSFVSDLINAAMHSNIVEQSLSGIIRTGSSTPSLWRILWPKIAALQIYGSSLIKQDVFVQMGPVHPAFNLLLWTAIVFAGLFFKFKTEEI